jgi:hypothetical protein
MGLQCFSSVPNRDEISGKSLQRSFPEFLSQIQVLIDIPCSKLSGGWFLQMTEDINGADLRRGIARVQWCCRCAIAVCALIDCWICRFRINPDGVSYLDMGDYYWSGNWHAALNSYWSPLYSWLTGLVLLAKPGMRWEYPLVHLLTFAILAAALFSFEFFWRALLASPGNVAWVGTWRKNAWILGYLLFAYVHLAVHRLVLVTPDLVVDALVYLAFGLMLRFLAGRMSVASALLLGVLLGAGYLTKAAMMPFAAVFLFTMLAAAWRLKLRKALPAVVLLGFLFVSLPFIAALSWNAHRLTWGDSAKVNLGWCVNKVSPPFRHWQGDRPDHTDALHPTRKLLGWPEVYEFATPIAGTYPVSYDASYWYAGLDSGMHLASELRTFRDNLLIIVQSVLLTSGFLVMTALMFVSGGSVKSSLRSWFIFWPIVVPAVTVFVMYMMVHWEARYTSGAMLVTWGTAMAATIISGEMQRTRVFWTTSLLLGALVVGRFTTVLMKDYREGGPSAQTFSFVERLQAAGINPGDHIALIGDGGLDVNWARLAKLRIVAELPHLNFPVDSATSFWNSGPQVEKAVLDILKSTGAKAVIADTHPAVLPPGWLAMGDTGSAVYFFR